jgi:hypothetical protein
MKAKHALVLIVIGYCLNFIGALLKILHRQEADFILIVATVLTVFGLLLFLTKIIKFSRFKEFLNS